MPPRYAYWTILIDDRPTAFRAHAREDLLPTLAQLRRTSANVVMKWFARGRVWDSEEAAREAQRRPATRETRSGDWRPGGVHRDPRDRFKKRAEGRRRPSRPPGESSPPGPPRGDRRPPRGDRPWHNKPRGPRGGGAGRRFPPRDERPPKKRNDGER